MNKIIHVSIFGDISVGKTTFIKRLCTNKFEDVGPTIIIDFETFILKKDDEIVKLNV